MQSSLLSLQAQGELERLKSDYRYFAKKHHRIVPKEGGVAVPFIFNTAQEYLYALVLAMWAELGYVRYIIVKGRQQGISTFIEGFFHWLALFIANFTVCILCHEADATAALFDKVKTFHENLPDQLKPNKLKADSEDQIKYPNGSKYSLFTAGSKESGRSQTAQAQHQSERGFFTKVSRIDKGIGQIVALVRNTFVFRESTGNGMNHFYREVLEALAGRNEWRVCFIPWFWQKEYRMKCPPDFIREPDEHELATLYGWDDEQIMWRRAKISDLGKGDVKAGLRFFRQEYPNTLMEAFQAPGDSFFDSDAVQKARKSTIQGDEYSPLVLGIDPGREGDRTVLVLRRGRCIEEIIVYETMDQMRLAGIAADIINRRHVDKCFIDYGMGHGTVDRLRERKFGAIVEGIYFGESPTDEQYLNKRAEMAYRFKDWLFDGEVNLPDSDDMAADIASMPDVELTSNSRKKFPTKEQIKESYGRSPDILDAIMLTFAQYVAATDQRFAGNVAIQGGNRTHTVNTKNGSEIPALAELRQPNQSYDWSSEENEVLWYDPTKVKKRGWGN